MMGLGLMKLALDLPHSVRDIPMACAAAPQDLLKHFNSG